MEKEFLGFSSKNGAWLTMKDEATDKQKDPVRSSGMQWSFSNKVSALPHFLSFKNTQEDRSRNTILDPLASSGYMNMSTKDAFDSNQKSFLGVTQKNVSIGKQGGNKNGMTIYPMQYSDAQSPSCLQETRIFSVSNNQSNQMNHILQPNLATTGLNMVNSITKPQSLGSKSSVSIGSSIVGSTDLRNGSKSNGTTNPTQMTIFYGGSVCVYDDISLEKIKSILLLAGNGSSPIQNKSISTSKLQQEEISIPSKNDGFSLSQTYPSSSPLPTPLSVTSHAGSQPGVGPSSNNELAMKRPIGPSTSPIIHLGSPIIASYIGSASMKRIQPGGLPQARKASLARFLEKRKERVVNTSPYYMCKKSSPECSNPGSNSGSFSMDFSGSCP